MTSPDDLRASLAQACTFAPPQDHLDLGVSGGADSVAMLVLATLHHRRVTVWHVDHGLRAESGEEAALVEAHCERFDAEFKFVSANLADGPNLEARAREERKRLLPVGHATGHTADDQAETVLVNLMRGAGIDGLSGMRPGPNHPLLALRRSETVALCEAWDLDYVRDPTNDDPRFVRNRVRHEVLPLLAEISGRDPVTILCRQAGVLRQDGEFIDWAACDLDATDGRALATAPPAIARRAVRRWLNAGNGHPPPLADVERVLAVARGEALGTEVRGGASIRRRGGRLFVAGKERGGQGMGDGVVGSTL